MTAKDCLRTSVTMYCSCIFINPQDCNMNVRMRSINAQWLYWLMNQLIWHFTQLVFQSFNLLFLNFGTILRPTKKMVRSFSWIFHPFPWTCRKWEFRPQKVKFEWAISMLKHEKLPSINSTKNLALTKICKKSGKQVRPCMPDVLRDLYYSVR